MDAQDFEQFVRETRRTQAEVILLKQSLQELQDKYNGLISGVEELGYELSELRDTSVEAVEEG